ncbi:MAG: DUF4440 domain-containing protein [Acidobacteria bacterium]|nr:DUF4440 domain-containing protein [Acidobacteriota bacterium]
MNAPADVQAIKDASLTWDKAWSGSNAEAVVSGFYTADAAKMDPNQPALVGQQAIRAASQKYFDQYTDEGRSILEDVRVSGDLAVAKGIYEGRATPKAGGSSAQVKDKFVTAFQRQADGSWKAFWDIYNSDLPMPGTTADGADEQAVMQVERDLATASVKRDIAVIERSVAKEYTSVADGKADDVMKMMAEFKAGAYQIESYTVSNLKVHVFGDAAIATMTQAVKGTYKGTAFSKDYRITDFFIKRDGRWQVVNEQSTTIKQ